MRKILQAPLGRRWFATSCLIIKDHLATASMMWTLGDHQLVDNFEPWEPFGSLTSPPAPKVPRRDSLAARDTNGQICQTALYSFSQGLACSKGADRQKVNGIAEICTFRLNFGQMHRFDPTWPQHRFHLGPTSASKAPTSAQLGPTWLQDGATWPQLNGGHSRPKPKSSKRHFH